MTRPTTSTHKPDEETCISEKRLEEIAKRRNPHPYEVKHLKLCSTCRTELTSYQVPHTS
ncbi:hypothetical protein KW790_01270 [Candidatus Parcubacteria bacterium]|nr:hypothetical protein [Candidatus Parcubacteria bacterium]